MLYAGGKLNDSAELRWWNEFVMRRECRGMVMCNRTNGTVRMVLTAVVVMVCREQRGKQQQAYYED